MSQDQFINSTSSQHPSSGYASRIHRTEWEKAKPSIRKWHNEGFTRKEICDKLRDEKHFACNTRQLDRQMTSWRMKGTTHKSIHSHEQLEYRESEQDFFTKASPTDASDQDEDVRSNQDLVLQDRSSPLSNGQQHHLDSVFAEMRFASEDAENLIDPKVLLPSISGDASPCCSCPQNQTCQPHPATVEACLNCAHDSISGVCDNADHDEVSNVIDIAETILFSGGSTAAYNIYTSLLSRARDIQCPRHLTHSGLYVRCVLGSLQSATTLETKQQVAQLLSPTFIKQALESSAAGRFLQFMYLAHRAAQSSTPLIDLHDPSCGHLNLTISPAELCGIVPSTYQSRSSGDASSGNTFKSFQVHVHDRSGKARQMFRAAAESSTSISLKPRATTLLRWALSSLIFETKQISFEELSDWVRLTQSKVWQTCLVRLLYWRCIEAQCDFDGRVTIEDRVEILLDGKALIQLSCSEIFILLARILTSACESCGDKEDLGLKLKQLCESEAALCEMIMQQLPHIAFPYSSDVSSMSMDLQPDFYLLSLQRRFSNSSLLATLNEIFQRTISTYHVNFRAVDQGKHAASHLLSQHRYHPTIPEHPQNEEAPLQSGDTIQRHVTAPEYTFVDPIMPVENDETNGSIRSMSSYRQYLRRLVRRQKDPDAMSIASSLRSRDTTDSQLSNRLAEALRIAPNSLKKLRARSVSSLSLGAPSERRQSAPLTMGESSSSFLNGI